MLGPLAVARSHANQGHARRLIAEGLLTAATEGQRLVLLVGDVPYRELTDRARDLVEGSVHERRLGHSPLHQLARR